MSALCRGPALFVSGPGALGPAVLSRRSVSACAALCVGVPVSGQAPRRCERAASHPVLLFQDSHCQVPAVCGPGALCRGPAALVGARRSRGALCVGARRFVSGPGALCVGARHGQRSLCRAPRSLCRGLALFLSALSTRVCLEPGLFLYRSSALFSALCVGARRSPPFSLCRDLCRRVCRGPGLTGGVGVCVAVSAMSGPGALRRPQLPSACHPMAPSVWHCSDRVPPIQQRGPAPIRVPPIQQRHPSGPDSPRLQSVRHPAGPPAPIHPAHPSGPAPIRAPPRRVPFFQERTQTLLLGGILHYITLRYLTLHYVTLRYITLHYVTLHCITLHYNELHYITLHRISYIAYIT